MKRTVIDVSLAARIQIYRDRTKQWRWRMRAKNGKVVADSAEAYRRKRDAILGLGIVFELIVEVVAAAIALEQKKARRRRAR